MDFAQIDSILQKDCGLTKDQPIIAAVSGGPDSLCLLDVLYRLGYRVVVAHFNHQLREQADQDARNVAQAAKRRSLPFVLGCQDVAAYSTSQGLSLEEAARILRYRFLFDQAREYHAQAVAVGHTADDQVESVLMHLLRGAGLAGLKGMSFCISAREWDAQLPLVRPLLGLWREETVQYCDEHGLKPVIDLSNQDTTFFRNRLRHELIPYLETYNPRIRSAIWRTSQALAGDYSILQTAVQEAWEKAVRETGQGRVYFHHLTFLSFSEGMQRSLLRRAIGILRPAMRDIDFEDIERGLAFARQPARSGQMDLVSGLRLFVEAGLLGLAEWNATLPVSQWPQIGCERDLVLAVPGEISVPGGWQLRADIRPVETDITKTQDNLRDPFSAWLDARSLSLPLEVRCRRPGDRFQPLGMDAHSLKLSDFFINEKLPQRARDRWPLVCSAGKIIWVPGYRPAHAFRLTADTRQMLVLKLVHPGD